MIVMSYRSPWENRGTERGEVGRGKPRTRANTNTRSAAARPEQVEVNGTERRRAAGDGVSPGFDPTVTGKGEALLVTAGVK